jgi:hypothetical protein
MLRGRRSASALADDARERGSDIAEGLGSAAGEMGSKAAETVSDLAERAADLARDAQRAASPVLRGAMASAAGRARDAQRTASPVVRSAAASAAEHAAEVLAGTAGRLAQPADELQLSARERLADASEQLARSIRPRRRRRLRIVLIGTGLVGIVVGVVISPLGARLRSMCGLGGTAPEPATTTPGIVLPGDPGATIPETDADAVSAGETGANGDRVLSGGRTRTGKTE